MLLKLTEWSRAHGADLLALAFLPALGAKYLYNAPRIVDIDLFDESDYLYSGVHLLQSGIRDASYGPLYSIWYFFLSLFAPDRISLYYLNYYVLTIATSVSLYLLLRSNKVPLWLSWALAALLLVLNVNVETSPRVSHFVLILILLSLAFASRAQNPLTALAYATVGALLTLFVRLEHGLNFLMAAVLLGAALIWSWRRVDRSAGFTAFGAFACIGVAFLILGNPLGGSYTGNERSYSAFEQHFAANWLMHNPDGSDPWSNTHRVIPKFFPTAHSLPQAFAENPQAILRHVRWNIPTLLDGLATRAFTTHFFTYPANRLSTLILLAALGLTFFFRRRRVLENIRQRWVVLLFLTSYLAVTVSAALITLPREIFLLRPIALLFALVAILLAGGSARSAPALKWVLVVGLLTLAWIPAYVLVAPGKTPNLFTIQVLRQLNIQKPVTFLAPTGSAGYYFTDSYKHLLTEDIGTRSVAQFLQEDGINMILVTPGLRRDNRYSVSSTWTRLLANPSDFDFTAFDIPYTENKLLVHKSLLPN